MLGCRYDKIFINNFTLEIIDKIIASHMSYQRENNILGCRYDKIFINNFTLDIIDKIIASHISYQREFFPKHDINTTVEF